MATPTVAAMTLSITEYSVFVALRAWIISVLGSSVEVIQELDNRVPTPKGGFVLMNCLNRKSLSWPVMSFVDKDAVGTIPAVTTFINTQPIDYAIQLDCYGPIAGDWVTMLSTMWNTEQACNLLEPYGFDPLYSGNPHQIAFVDGEKQYQHRWVMDVHIQYNPAITTSMQFASSAEVDIINVDRNYPI